MENVRIAVLDSHDTTICFLDNGAKKGLRYFDDELHVYLQGAACTFSFTSSSRHANSKYLVVGNKLAFKYNNKDYYFNIMSEKRDEKEVRIEGYSTNLELLNETTGPYRAPRAMSFDEYITAFGFARGVIRLGLNEVSNMRITHEWEGTATILNRLFSLANVFSAEVEFVPVLSNTYSLERIVLNVYRRNDGDDNGLGQYRPGVVLRYGVEIEGITKKSDITGLYTAIRPRGRDGLNILGLDRGERDEHGNWEFRTLPGSLEILAPLARDRFPSNVMEGVSDRFITMEWEYDTPNSNVLYGQALDRLRKNSVPKVSYEVKGHFNTDVGDTVRIVDEEYNPPLFLRARVVEQIRSFTNPSRDRTIFDNFTELQSEIAPSLLARMQQLLNESRIFAGSIVTDNGIIFRNREGETTLTAVVMDRGTNITNQFEIRWIREGYQIATGASITVQAGEVPDRAVYRFEALNNEGVIRAMAEATLSNIEDGTPSVTVNAGPEAIVFPATSGGLVQAETIFTVFFNAFLGGNRLACTAAVGTLPSGMSLQSNTPATTTADGSIVLRIEQGATLGGAAIGTGFIQVTYTAGENAFPRIISWSKAFAGESGTSGPPGVSLLSVESFFLVSQLSSGVTTTTPGWSQEIPTMTPTNRFLWRYDRQYFSDNRVVGTTPIVIGNFSLDGANGSDGVGISSTEIRYQVGTNGTTPPVGGTWSTNIPIVPPGSFLWTRIVITYTNNTSTTSFLVSRMGIDGVDGVDGDSVSIVSTLIQYQAGTSGTVAPTGAWSVTIPNVPQGRFLWTRTTVTYSDGAQTVSFSVSRMGEDGRDGVNGDSGIIISETAPASPSLNQLWQQSPGEPIRRWNGNEWVIHFLSAENLEVESLSAISADMGTITAGMITNADQTVIFDVNRGSLESFHEYNLSAGIIESRHTTLYRGTLIAETTVFDTLHEVQRERLKTEISGDGIVVYQGRPQTNWTLERTILINFANGIFHVDRRIHTEEGFVTNRVNASWIGATDRTTALVVASRNGITSLPGQLHGVFSAPVPTGRFGCGAMDGSLAFFFGTEANISANTNAVQHILQLRTNGNVHVLGNRMVVETENTFYEGRLNSNIRFRIEGRISLLSWLFDVSNINDSTVGTPIIFRQVRNNFGFLIRQVTLLDADGHSLFPGRLRGLREGWLSLTVGGGFIAGAGFEDNGIRYQRAGNMVSVYVNNVRSNGVAKPIGSYTLATIPAGFRPGGAVSCSFTSGAEDRGRIVVSSTGVISINIDTNMGTRTGGIFGTVTYAVP